MSMRMIVSIVPTRHQVIESRKSKVESRKSKVESRKPLDSGFRREDGGVRLDTGDKGRDEVAVEGVQPFACGWVELFSTSLVGKVAIDGGADCDCPGGLGVPHHNYPTLGSRPFYYYARYYHAHYYYAAPSLSRAHSARSCVYSVLLLSRSFAHSASR